MEFNLVGTKDEIIYWGKRLYEKGMSPSCSGNISTKTKKGILITASGTCANDLDQNDIVLIDYNGNLLEGTKKASSEKIMHTEIYTKRDDINAIIHCHCPMITAFCVAHKSIKKPIIPDFCYSYDEIPLIPFYCPSSLELADSVGRGFEKNNALLLSNHGIVLGADTMQNAFYQLESIRMYCETYFASEVLGGAKVLSKKSIQEIKNLNPKNK